MIHHQVILVRLFIFVVVHTYFIQCFVPQFIPHINLARKLYSTSKSEEAYNDHFSHEFDIMTDSMRYFREYAKRGLQRFMDHDLDGAVKDFQRAAMANSTQPLSQLGIFLYCAGKYSDAEVQLELDIQKIESLKFFKATDLRLWRCASLNKLGRVDDAKRALDNSYLTSTGLVEHRPLMNMTLQFYGGELQVEELLDFIGTADEKDFSGTSFFGNFYLGLYFDSIGDMDMSRTFLSIPKNSNRYPTRDVWFHLPRVLYEQRFGSSADDDSNVEYFQ